MSQGQCVHGGTRRTLSAARVQLVFHSLLRMFPLHADVSSESSIALSSLCSVRDASFSETAHIRHRRGARTHRPPPKQRRPAYARRAPRLVRPPAELGGVEEAACADVRVEGLQEGFFVGLCARVRPLT